MNGPGAATKGRVLAVDDQEENLELLDELLGTEGYEVLLARDGVEALSTVEENDVDCVVLDVMMPRLDGFEVCRRLRGDPRSQLLPVVILTALSSVQDKVQGLDAGADDFLNKPLRREELLARVRSLVRIKRLRDELDTSESVVFTMVQALESKDPQDAGHSERVAAASMAVARRLGLPPREREAVAKGAMLHDIGKLGVPDDVLRAPRPRPAEAEALYRQHPELGERILLPLRSLVVARDVVRHHHERLDGSGYPDGLYGPEIAVPAQIVMVANYYDDLLRCDGLGHKDAGERLRAAAAEGLFARDVVEPFLESGAMVIASGDWEADAWSELVPLAELSRGGTVLVGDDTPANREMFADVLGEAGFQVVTVADGTSVLSAISEGGIDLAIVDLRMPGLDGFTVCERLKKDPETEFLPVVLVTAYGEATDRARGIEVGADDFFSLPLNRLELTARVRSLMRLRMYSRDLEDHHDVVLSLASVLEAKDPYTRGHSARVGDLASRLGREIGLPDRECELLRLAGLLHDIGKVGIPGWIINKPGRLSHDEFLTVMSHPGTGESLCRPLKTIQAILPYIRHHHERFDGRGYPDGLTGDAIPVGARVLALADAFEALTADRSYRKRMTSEEALGLLARETAEGHWDPQYLPALERMVKDGV